ncbi:hypothetical protein GG344DRAFT_79032 [Lentinula edodes]|nr:hypothetical protein GG344DRAFT_79032 [Lentinula edodes]
MGPQRTARHSVSTRHRPHQFPELRRHPMLTRSMARAQPAPTTITSSDPPFEHLQRHSSQEVCDPSFLANSASHIHVTHGHYFQEASGSSSNLNANSFLDFLQGYSSREAPDPHSLLDTTTSDLNTLGELPSKPRVPSELLTNFDQSFVMDLEMFNTRSQRLFDEQKKSLEFTELHIDILAHQCTDLRAISHLRQGIQRLEHCCPFCKDLAWSPHPVDTPLAQVVSAMSDNDSSSLTGYSNVQYAGSQSVENLFHPYCFNMRRGCATHRSTRRSTLQVARALHVRRHPMVTRSRTLRISGNDTLNFPPLVPSVSAYNVAVNSAVASDATVATPVPSDGILNVTPLPPASVVNATVVDSANTTIADPVPLDVMSDDDRDNKFYEEVRAYLDYSSDILNAQAEEVQLLRREVASVREEKAALKQQYKLDTDAREEAYRCSICLDLAWDPYVLPCGHSFCARCLSQHRINDFRTKARNSETLLVTCCPLCRAEVYQKPVYSCAIQQGVQLVAKEIGIVAPPPFKLRWPW